MLELYIANKNYSSWSMRPWLVLKAFEIPFQEHMIYFDRERSIGAFKQKLLSISDNAKVPILYDQEVKVWDSLAICEYLAEQYPEYALWPKDKAQRARARSISAEMHSGFTQLRTLCGMNIRAHLAEVGQRLWAENSELRQDVARIEQIWAERPDLDGFLCGAFSIADAFYAPVVMRFKTYALPVSASSQRYMQSMLQHPAVQAWVEAAMVEGRWVNYLEAYQTEAE
ncbi:MULTISPECIES: glutathione S-transferase family protein [Acinetobacter]|uniref:Glutathione S-transferase n=1 Tax=Acinetobacter tandoii DSM 14970 = CIP 107469 TaxID=1120927 RepID=R9AR98_9GAMM|nr:MULTISPECIES: glutathione S-transferase family protein [Acinetobacter]AUX85890.1 glutathione S-transferase family protein [Acinetobacter sp. ACNIH2]EOR02611.1 glutathione S-transferase [Acinetobacter tandoii DSM 14970 = CIP 107469]